MSIIHHLIKWKWQSQMFLIVSITHLKWLIEFYFEYFEEEGSKKEIWNILLKTVKISVRECKIRKWRLQKDIHTGPWDIVEYRPKLKTKQNIILKDKTDFQNL